jgi:hypothetical protein
MLIITGKHDEEASHRTNRSIHLRQPKTRDRPHKATIPRSRKRTNSAVALHRPVSSHSTILLK